jgi:riboflavin biosynthesis pyrimidine reductase
VTGTDRNDGTGKGPLLNRDATTEPADAYAAEQLELLYEAPGLPAAPLPPRLGGTYGGTLGFDAPVLYGNLVSTVDGITALDDDAPPAVVADRNTADRFVMGLLRATAEAVLVGASTLRAEPRHLWLPEKVFPQGKEDFAALRAALGLAPEPRLVIVTASGRLDPGLPALAGGATVLTTSEGAELFRSALAGAGNGVQGSRGSGAPHLTVRALGDGPVLNGARIVAALRQEGHGTVLTEGGPHLIGTLLEAGMLDELFLTISPLLAGDRFVPGRRGVVEGVRFGLRSGSSDIAAELRRAALLSIRRHGSHLFLRYALARDTAGR